MDTDGQIEIRRRRLREDGRRRWDNLSGYALIDLAWLESMMTFLPTDVLSRRLLIFGALSLGVTAVVPAVAQTRPDPSHAGDATPSAAPNASPLASPAGEVVDVTFTAHLMFDPEVLTVPQGTTVRWANESGLPHTVTCDPEKVLVPDTALMIEYPAGTEPWASDLLYSGETFTHAFEVAGTYRYICVPHIAVGMSGTIIVE